MGVTFLALPGELREMIYVEFFSSITIYYGFGRKKTNNTSILQTCRQIYREATLIMHSNISLGFKNKALMKYWLVRAHRHKYQNIRHMALQPYEHCLSREGFDVSTMFNTLNALQVNGLVIEHCNLDFAISNYSRIELLPNIPVLINSDGWMELSVAVPVAAFKESKRYYESNQSARQPAVWNEMLVFRDGADSGAEVKMYVADNHIFETSCVELVSTTEHDKKRLLIVARRGRGTRNIQVAKLAVRWWSGLVETWAV
jgi:hypothetical protein